MAYVIYIITTGKIHEQLSTLSLVLFIIQCIKFDSIIHNFVITQLDHCSTYVDALIVTVYIHCKHSEPLASASWVFQSQTVSRYLTCTSATK